MSDVRPSSLSLLFRGVYDDAMRRYLADPLIEARAMLENLRNVFTSSIRPQQRELVTWLTYNALIQSVRNTILQPTRDASIAPRCCIDGPNGCFNWLAMNEGQKSG